MIGTSYYNNNESLCTSPQGVHKNSHYTHKQRRQIWRAM